MVGGTCNYMIYLSNAGSFGKVWIHPPSGVNLRFMNTILLAFVFLWLGCGSGTSVQKATSPASTACPAGTAQILIGDGFLMPTCGCIGAGESGKVYPFPGNLTCHLATSNTQVFFYLWGTQLPHQIVSTGSRSFLSSPVMDSKKTSQLSSFVVSFPLAASTYEFHEIYTGMIGQFFVP